MLGRMVHVKSSAGELYYLRLLLLHVRGEHAISFGSLQRSPSSDVPPSFQQLAREMSLLQDDSETASMLADAMQVLTSTAKVYELIAETFVWLEISDFAAVWDYFLDLMAKSHAPVDPAQIYVAVDILLHGYSMSLASFGIARPPNVAALSTDDRTAREYAAELRTELEMLEERAAYEALMLNQDQQSAFDLVRSLVDNECSADLPNVVFVDGPAGTGKTFLYRKVLHYVRMSGRIALAVAFSGIAALLLPGGRTAHSRFRLPVPLPTEGCCCNIKGFLLLWRRYL